MFSSNQKFIITGDRIEDLKEVMTCALNMYYSPTHSYNGGRGIEAYKIEDDGTMVFYSYYNDRYIDKLTLIPKEEIGNFQYLILNIQLYLSSQKYKNIANNLSHYDGDGTSRIGWELGCYDMYYEQLVEENDKANEKSDKYICRPDYDHYACLYLKPYWTYYAK